jgi:hypothetical protein
MNKRLAVAVAALGAAIVLAVTGPASAYKPSVSVSGELETIFNGGFTPTKLSKTKLTPISFFISGEIKSRNPEEPHPPAMKEFILEGDKNTAVSVDGIPVCQKGLLESQNSAGARKACGPALIGTGKALAGIKFPEQPEILANSEVLVFNGGTHGGTTTFYIHAYITVPTPAAIVTVTKIKRIHKGRYGVYSVSTIPRIAGGAGSIKSFSLKLNKGIVSAKCPDGHLDARGEAIFADGNHLKASVLRPCTGKG